METYKHKMDAVNILREFTNCSTFPFLKIKKATFYHYAAQIHVYLKRAHQVLDNTNIQLKPPSNFYCWPSQGGSSAFGSLVILDVARCCLCLFTLYINIKIGKIVVKC